MAPGGGEGIQNSVTVIPNQHPSPLSTSSATQLCGMHKWSESSTDSGLGLVDCHDNMRYSDRDDDVLKTEEYMMPIPSYRPHLPPNADGDNCSSVSSSSRESKEIILQISKTFRNKLPNSMKRLAKLSQKRGGRMDKSPTNSKKENVGEAKRYENQETINRLKNWKARLSNKIRRSRGSDRNKDNRDSQIKNNRNVKTIIHKFESPNTEVIVVKPKVNATSSAGPKLKRKKIVQRLGPSLMAEAAPCRNSWEDNCINAGYYINPSQIASIPNKLHKGFPGVCQENKVDASTSQPARVLYNGHKNDPHYIEIIDDSVAVTHTTISVPAGLSQLIAQNRMALRKNHPAYLHNSGQTNDPNITSEYQNGTLSYNTSNHRPMPSVGPSAPPDPSSHA